MASGGTDDAPHERRVFVRTMLLTLVLAVPAMLLVATWLLGWRDTRGACAAFWPQLAVGFAAMLAFTLATAPVLAPRCARSPSLLGPYCAFLFAFGDAAGCLANRIGEGGDEWFDSFVNPFVWLLLFGALPAFLLGGVAMLIHRWLDPRL